MDYAEVSEGKNVPDPAQRAELAPKRKRGRPRKDPIRASTQASSQHVKRPRGRPPKRRAVAAARATAATVIVAAAAATTRAAAAAQTPADHDIAQDSSHPAKRRRGRPPGARNKARGGGRPALIPHVLTVNIGEDVHGKLRDLSASTRRSVVVLAATGMLSAATLMQLNSTGEAVGVTLKGTFTILGLSGALLQAPEHAHTAKREPSTGEFLSTSLANASGGVIGGTVAGALEAASPVIVVVGQWDSEEDTTNSDADQAFSPQSAAAAAAQVGLTGLLEAAAAAGAGGLLLGLAGLPGQAVGWPDVAAAAVAAPTADEEALQQEDCGEEEQDIAGEHVNGVSNYDGLEEQDDHQPAEDTGGSEADE